MALLSRELVPPEEVPVKRPSSGRIAVVAIVEAACRATRIERFRTIYDLQRLGSRADKRRQHQRGPSAPHVSRIALVSRA